MKRNKLLVLNCETLEFEVKELPSNEVGYEVLNEAVGGWIEHITYNREFVERHIDMWCNEEGKLKDLKPSVAIVDKMDIIVEILVGNIAFTKCDCEGNSFGLTDEEVEFTKSKFDTAYLSSPHYSNCIKTLKYK